MALPFKPVPAALTFSFGALTFGSSKYLVETPATGPSADTRKPHEIRLLIKQSYGIRDFKYLRLKIRDLPSRRIKTHI